MQNHSSVAINCRQFDQQITKTCLLQETHIFNFILVPFCSLRYQQTTVKVFAKFLAQDPDSGRTVYFPSRSTELDVTQLVLGHGLRISNSGIATLKGNVVQGLSPGRADIKVSFYIMDTRMGTLLGKIIQVLSPGRDFIKRTYDFKFRDCDAERKCCPGFESRTS